MTVAYIEEIRALAGCDAYGCELSLRGLPWQQSEVRHEGLSRSFLPGDLAGVLEWLRGHHSAGHPLGMDDASYAEAFDYAVSR